MQPFIQERLDRGDLGYKTGEMATQILKGEADISQMPIEYANASKLYNADMCQELGITVPEGYTALEGLQIISESESVLMAITA